jgi:flagellar FliL protein
MADENQEAEEEGEEGVEGEGEQPKKKKKGLLIVIILIVLLAGGGGAAFFLGLIPGLGASQEGAGSPEGNSPAHSAEVTDEEGNLIVRSIYYDMEEFVVNLNVGSQTPSFLKMTISLELPSESQIPVIEAKMPRIRDSFQVYLRELRQQDLQGSAGMYRLREELLLRINKTVYPAKVNDILFKEILVQ